MQEGREEWKSAMGHYLRISRILPPKGDGSKSLMEEARQAAARAKKLKGYLDAVRVREEKMKNRVPFLR